MSERQRTARLVAVGRVGVAAVQLPAARLFDVDAVVVRRAAGLAVPVRCVGASLIALVGADRAAAMVDTWVIVVAVSVAYLGAAVRDRLLRRPPRRPGPQHHQQRLHLRAVDRASTPRPGRTTAASAAPRRPASASCRSISARRSWSRCGGSCCARSSGSASATASPRSPTSSRRATARASCSAAWSRSSPWSGSSRTSRCSSRPSRPRSRSCAATRARPRRRVTDPPILHRHRPVRGAAAGRLHHRVRHPPPRRHRAARGHGRRDRLRVARQARRVPGRRLLRDVRDLRRVRRHLRPGAQPSPSWPSCSRFGDDRELRHVLLADGAVDARDPAAPAAVAGGGGGERGRAARPDGDVGVPAVPAADQHLRAADRARRPAHVRRRRRQTPTRSCWRCRWPTSSACSRSSSSSADCRRPPAWSSSRRSRCRRWCRTRSSMPVLLRRRSALADGRDLGSG